MGKDLLINDNLYSEITRFTMGQFRHRQYYSDVEIKYNRIIKESEKSVQFELLTKQKNIFITWIPKRKISYINKRNKKVKIDGWMAHIKNEEYKEQ
jgi:hypothetical protein